MLKNKYSEKILQLAEILGISPDAVVMPEDTFDIIETYCDTSGIHHWEIRLRSTQQIVLKKPKRQ
jgi:hypothetical protein